MSAGLSNDATITDRLFSPKSLNDVTYDRNGVCNTHLKEESCKDSVVDIVGLPEDVRILTIADFPQTEHFFAGHKLGCRGDFTILDTVGKLIIHLEIKRSKKSGVKDQLLGSSALIPYFRALAAKKLSEGHYLAAYKERFVSVGYTSLDMRNMSGRRISGNGESIDDIRRIFYPGLLQYRNLI